MTSLNFLSLKNKDSYSGSIHKREMMLWKLEFTSSLKMCERTNTVSRVCFLRVPSKILSRRKRKFGDYENHMNLAIQ